MPLVVADTGPLHYLVLIGHFSVLPALFESVNIPSTVRDELTHAEAPDVVRAWTSMPPGWLEVHPDRGRSFDVELQSLDEGEKAALTLATSLGADLLLMDDRTAVRLARSKGFRVIGTLRVLQLAALRGLLDLADAYGRLIRTNFRCRPEIMDMLIRELQEE